MVFPELYGRLKLWVVEFPYDRNFEIQSTLVISNSKGLTETNSRYPYLDISELREWGSEFSETPIPAYYYAYFCFCTRKISFRWFSFTPYCHRTSKLNFKDVPRTSEIPFVRRNRYPKCPKIVKKPAHFWRVIWCLPRLLTGNSLPVLTEL